MLYFQIRGINEAIRNVEELTPEELVRLWAHEALRLFHDQFQIKFGFFIIFFCKHFRLIYDNERQWTKKQLIIQQLNILSMLI